MLATGWPSGMRPERSTASIVTASSPSFCEASTTLAPPRALVFHLVLDFVDLGARVRSPISFLICGGDAFIGRHRARLDLADLDQRHAEAALYGLADFARWQRERRIRNRRIDDRALGDHPEVDVGQIEIALLGKVVERRSRR